MRFVLVTFFLLCSSASAQYNDYLIKVHRTIDGDTFVCTFDLGLDVELKNQTVRVSNFDAWETSKIRRTVDVTNEEVAKGKKAKADLEKIFSEATIIYARVQKKKYRDSYGRLLVKIYVTSPSLGTNAELSEIMTDLGNVRE